MKNRIKLTESQLRKTITKIIKEELRNESKTGSIITLDNTTQEQIINFLNKQWFGGIAMLNELNLTIDEFLAQDVNVQLSQLSKKYHITIK